MTDSADSAHSTVDNPRQNVTFPSGGGTAHGYLATPSSGTGPGVIVVQEWWGLDDHIVDICDRLAGEGFVTLAPDLYGGRVAHDTDDAGAMMEKLPAEQGAKQLSGAVDFLLGHDAVTSTTVGVVGFCMGGGFALALGAQEQQRIGAVVTFYGVGQAVPDSYSTLTAPVQGHYGNNDDFYPVAQAHEQEEQIRRESSNSVEFFYYDAAHAFHNDKDKLGTYDADAAKQAWTRTVTFLHDHLVG